ncbi:helix-turn-helix domain-containing protein [Temperatibacter marinus]|uniref:Helix-turn-helix domain-containing protein n=1 Tax=Temperatibacter marinus TaxID=1456591 RepID=A0AA52EGS8_9PROT|nr:helix-turn-helix domain-containing protein [Temperatibacter marinus]WND01796.1 helix-turn-helix domain-containing protein [Temperatibacter marinus]
MVKTIKYGQFCPIAKATELLGDRWSLLIIRELLMGANRFSQIKNGLSSISPTLLTTRLKAFEENGLLYKRMVSGRRGYEYLPTEPMKDLLPVILSLGDWGMKWAKDNLTDEDYDVEFLMTCLQRSIIKEKLPGDHTIIQFKFLDIIDHPNWWLIVSPEDVDICVKDPGHDVDVFFTSSVKTLTDVWIGHDTYRRVINAQDLVVVGPKALTRNINSWLSSSPFARE